MSINVFNLVMLVGTPKLVYKPTMNIHLPPRRITRLHEQPSFPNEDLSDDNTHWLKYLMASEGGVMAQAETLREHQQHLIQIAIRALYTMGIRNDLSPAAKFAFSHGFAGFETISDLVHPPRIYNAEVARLRAEQFLIDTRARDAMDVALEQLLNGDGNETLSLDGKYDGWNRMALTPEMEESLGITDSQIDDDAGKVFTERHKMLPTQYPNTYDVVVHMGEVIGEPLNLLQLRVAGASLARTLQTLD